MNVLVIEADPALRRAVQYALALHGHTAVTARGVREFNRLARSQPFPLAIIGQLLPEDGPTVDLCREARESRALRDSYLLVLVERDDFPAIVAALDAGANGYLSRHLDIDQLRMHLESLERAVPPLSSTLPSLPPESRAARAAVLVEEVVGVTLIVQPDGTVSWANAAITRLLGRLPNQLHGLSIYLLCHPDDAAQLERLLVASAAEPEPVPVPLRLLHQDGSWRDLAVTAHDYRQQPAIGGIVIHGHPVSQRGRWDEAQRATTLHDPLTGLPNRSLFMNYVERFLAQAERRGEPVIVVYVDIDDFQTVNAEHGRVVGDALLAAVAERLVGTLRAADATARLGGDEFAVLLSDVATRDDAAVVAGRLLDALQRPYALQVSGTTLDVLRTCSIGLAFSPPGMPAARGESRLEEVLRRADRALFRAKSRGRGRWVLYDERNGTLPADTEQRGVALDTLGDRPPSPA
jgi:diguanylate cyclase (GGDEF)-like protein